MAVEVKLQTAITECASMALRRLVAAFLIAANFYIVESTIAQSNGGEPSTAWNNLVRLRTLRKEFLQSVTVVNSPFQSNIPSRTFPHNNGIQQQVEFKRDASSKFVAQIAVAYIDYSSDAERDQILNSSPAPNGLCIGEYNPEITAIPPQATSTGAICDPSRFTPTGSDLGREYDVYQYSHGFYLFAQQVPGSIPLYRLPLTLPCPAGLNICGGLIEQRATNVGPAGSPVLGYMLSNTNDLYAPGGFVRCMIGGEMRLGNYFIASGPGSSPACQLIGWGPTKDGMEAIDVADLPPTNFFDYLKPFDQCSKKLYFSGVDSIICAEISTRQFTVFPWGKPSSRDRQGNVNWLFPMVSRLAMADITGDGSPDLIIGSGRARYNDQMYGSAIRVYDIQNQQYVGGSFARLQPYVDLFKNGVYVSAGDVNGDGRADIIATPGPGGGPHLRIFNGTNGQIINEYFTYASTMSAGVRTATADFNGDGRADIVTIPATSGVTADVKIFSGADGSLLGQFPAYPGSVQTGFSVAAGDIDGDGIPEILTCPRDGGSAQVRTFSLNGTMIREYWAFNPNSALGGEIVLGRYNGNNALVVSNSANKARALNPVTGAMLPGTSDMDIGSPATYSGGQQWGYIALPPMVVGSNPTTTTTSSTSTSTTTSSTTTSTTIPVTTTTTLAPVTTTTLPPSTTTSTSPTTTTTVPVTTTTTLPTTTTTTLIPVTTTTTHAPTTTTSTVPATTTTTQSATTTTTLTPVTTTTTQAPTTTTSTVPTTTTTVPVTTTTTVPLLTTTTTLTAPFGSTTTTTQPKPTSGGDPVVEPVVNGVTAWISPAAPVLKLKSTKAGKITITVALLNDALPKKTRTIVELTPLTALLSVNPERASIKVPAASTDRKKAKSVKFKLSGKSEGDLPIRLRVSTPQGTTETTFKLRVFR